MRLRDGSWLRRRRARSCCSRRAIAPRSTPSRARRIRCPRSGATSPRYSARTSRRSATCAAIASGAHLFRVTAGVDSMILGEAQIHGQVRDAWERSRGASGAVLSRLFQSALMVGGRVRSETGIGRGAASTSSAAVQLASKIFGSLNGRHAMVLGAGEMAELALECLVRRRRAHRDRRESDARAGARARGALPAEALHYDECWSRLADVDLLLCSTASPRPIVGVEQIGRIAQGAR